MVFRVVVMTVAEAAILSSFAASTCWIVRNRRHQQHHDYELHDVRHSLYRPHRTKKNTSYLLI